MMDRVEIIPGILEGEWEDVEKKLEVLWNIASWIHLDVTDGKFTPRKSWQDPVDLLRRLSRTHQEENPAPQFEIHLMIVRPWESIESWIATGARRFIVHWEACSKKAEDILHTEELISRLKSAGKEIVFGVKLETALPDLSHYLPGIDGVLLMAHKVGYSSVPLDPSVFAKIGSLRHQYPDVTIELDGGVSDATIADSVRAGARRMVATSYVWSHNTPEEALETLIIKGREALVA